MIWKEVLFWVFALYIVLHVVFGPLDWVIFIKLYRWLKKRRWW